MLKNLIVLFCSVSWICLAGCNIRTPEIRGVVLDEETKQPVEGAWVHATVWVSVKTVQGDVGRVISLEQPHTRTSKNGTFLIPRREIDKFPLPAGFGTRVDKFNIVVSTLDRSGKAEIDQNHLRKKTIDLTIFMEDIEKAWEKELQHVVPDKVEQEREMREFSSLQALYNYCLTGRFSVEVPPVEGGCDEWELNYAIAKHEGYLQRYKILAEQSKIKGYFAAIEQLSELFGRKGDYKKAIEVLKLKIYLMEKRGLLKFEDWVVEKKNLESEIRRLQEKLKGVEK